MIESAINNLLSDDETVSGLVGTKIYPLLADENALEPYIVFQIISNIREHTFETTIDMVKARVQISCWAKTYYDAITLKNAVISCLDNYAGTEATSSTVIQCIHIDDENDIIDFTAGIDENKRFGKRLDFFVWYNE